MNFIKLFLSLGIGAQLACIETPVTTVGSGSNVSMIFTSNVDSIEERFASQIDCPQLEAQYAVDPVKFVNSGAPITLGDYVTCKYPNQVIAVRRSGSAELDVLNYEEASKFQLENDIISRLGGLHDHFGITNSSEVELNSPTTLHPIVYGPVKIEVNSVPNRIVSRRGLNTGKLGGCGVWAAGISNRTLGFSSLSKLTPEFVLENCPYTPAISPEYYEEGRLKCFTQAEYDGLWDDLGTTLGVTPMTFAAKYYAEKGYCSDYKKFKGTPEDFKEAAEAANSGCALKLDFGKSVSTVLTPSSPYFLTDPGLHIESVIAICTDAECVAKARNACTKVSRKADLKYIDPFWLGKDLPDQALVTNSWGSYACISGGSKNAFHHSRNPAFHDLWPPEATDVFIDYICPCETTWPTFDDLKTFLQDQLPAN